MKIKNREDYTKEDINKLWEQAYQSKINISWTTESLIHFDMAVRRDINKQLNEK